MKSNVLPRSLLCLGIALFLAAPRGSWGDTLRLLDGTVLRGRMVSFLSDTLTFHTSFGSDIRVAREKIYAIEFTDSALPVPTVTGAAVGVEAESAEAPGELFVMFKDRKLSSKIVVEKGKDEETLIRANWITQVLLVDGDTMFAHIDSAMDKTIYKGPKRQYKNEIELEDILVEVPPGPHHVAVLVRNVGADEYGERFEDGPLSLLYEMPDVQVYSDRSRVITLRLDKGTLRLKTPKFRAAD